MLTASSHRVGHGAQPRAEHDAHARRQVRAQDGGGLGGAHASDSSSKASGSSSPMVVVCDRAAGAPEVHRRVGRGELLQALAAAAARRADVELLGHHGDGADLALAGGDHRADGRRLRALALRIGGVLDVGADVDRPGGRAQRGADREVRVGRVGVAHDRVGGGQQRLRRRRAAGRSRSPPPARRGRAPRAGAPRARARARGPSRRPRRPRARRTTRGRRPRRGGCARSRRAAGAGACRRRRAFPGRRRARRRSAAGSPTSARR